LAPQGQIFMVLALALKVQATAQVIPTYLCCGPGLESCTNNYTSWKSKI